MDFLFNETMVPSTMPGPMMAATVAPTMAPTATPHPWVCFPSEDGEVESGVTCLELLQGKDKTRVPASLPEPMLVEFTCYVDEDNFSEAEKGPTTTNGDCDSFCQMSYNDTSCRGCALLDSGEMAYDCRNVFTPPVEQLLIDDDHHCFARDASGKCHAVDGSGPDNYVHWTCFPNSLGGVGFGCYYNLNQEYLPSNPALDEIADEAPNSLILLYCGNDIAGLSAADCEEPVCLAMALDWSQGQLCGDCDVVQGNFTYDCSMGNSFNLSCPIRLANGTCAEYEPLPRSQEREVWIPGVNQSQIASSTAPEDSGSSKWVWTLKRINPTTFNVVSDLFSHLTRLAIGAAIASLYAGLMTWQIHSHRTVPLDQMGGLAGDSIQGLGSLRKWKWSLPILTLVALLLIADFSHSIADVGLDFESVEVEGGDESVLVIATHKRNQQRPLEIAGDPVSARTRVFSDTADPRVGREDAGLIYAYINGVRALARGESPFFTNGDPTGESFVRSYLSWGGISGFLCFFVTDNGPLVEMDLELPVACSSTDMAEIKQISTGQTKFDVEVRNVARVPQCMFTDRRDSGIFGGPSGSVQVLEHADMIGVPDSGLLLRKGNVTGDNFNVNPESKRLARDRENWAEGRVFYDIDQAVIGNITIDFGRIVVASGVDASTTDTENTRRTEYGLFAEVKGACPPRPSGHPVQGLSCFAMAVLACDTFPEDFVASQHPVYHPPLPTSQCRTNQFSLVWGKNFDADPEFVSVLAGVYGLNHPSANDQSLDAFIRNGPLAALLAMATVEKRTSIDIVVRPSINMIYVVFMSLPVLLCIVIVAIVHWTRPYCLPIPESSWHLMVMAKDEPLIPHRTGDNFPAPPSDLHFALGNGGGPFIVQGQNPKGNGLRRDSSSAGSVTPAATP